MEPSLLQRTLYQEFQESQVSASVPWGLAACLAGVAAAGGLVNTVPWRGVCTTAGSQPCLAATHSTCHALPLSTSTPGAGSDHRAGVWRRAGWRGRPPAARLPVPALPAQAVQPPAAGAGPRGARPHAGGEVGEQVCVCVRVGLRVGRMPELGAGEGGWQAHLFTTDP